MSEAILINGDNGQLKNWSQVNWQKAYKVVKNLRCRIFRARKLGQWKQLRRLQKLLIRSRSNLLLSVKQITQVNAGKPTAGIDKEVINTPAQGVKLVNEWEMPKAVPTKRVYISKPNGKKPPLGIPSLRDRVTQAIVKNSLEPEWEAIFEPNSYGFRCGRSCHDGIEGLFMKLNSNARSGGHKWVLDADIKGFFDNIAHESILSMIDSHPSRELIKGWLKAGFIHHDVHNPTETGIPQGGVISPLLANIGLHGLEGYIQQCNPKIGIIRYADDFVITAKDKESLEKVLIQIKQWLSERGLEISTEKTRIVHIDDGFDFLGFNLRQYNGKLLIKPQKEKVFDFCTKIGKTLSEMKARTQQDVITKLNPLLRGFANYYRGVVSKKSFSYIENRVWHYLYRWAKRRHPNKSKKWVFKRYFHSFRGRNGVFMCKGIGRKGQEVTHILYNIASTSITRHIKVKGNASPDDSSLREYWNNRKLKQGKNDWATGRKHYQIVVNQDWNCPVCGENLFNGE